MTDERTQLQIPPKLIPLFAPPRGALRYRCSHGGRGSAKTRTFALMTAVFAYMMAEQGMSGVILCGRELMNSLEDSSMEEVKKAIKSVPFLNAYFEIGERYIRTRNRRIDYIFCGLRHNLDSIKSKANILLAWVDEAESVSDIAWKKLRPTVRESGSEIWVTWNPEKEGSATDTRFRLNTPSGCMIVEMNYSDNPWFPEVLELERQDDLRILNPEEYAWIWEGAYRKNSEAVIFSGRWQVETFTPQPHWNGPYYGLDFGFSTDPTAANEVWIADNRLYIHRDFSRHGLELDHTPRETIKAFPGIEKHVIRADCARPDSISYLKRNGLPRIQGDPKLEVEDGIAHMKHYEKIIVHPSCKATRKELMLYSYKVDRLSGDVMTDIVDANNHNMDAIRYALYPIIKASQDFLSAMMKRRAKN